MAFSRADRNNPWEFGSVRQELASQNRMQGVIRDSPSQEASGRKEVWKPARRNITQEKDVETPVKIERGNWEGLSEEGVQRMERIMDDAEAGADRLEKKVRLLDLRNRVDNPPS